MIIQQTWWNKKVQYKYRSFHNFHAVLYFLISINSPSFSLTVAYLLFANGQDCLLHKPVTLCSFRQNVWVVVLKHKHELSCTCYFLRDLFMISKPCVLDVLEPVWPINDNNVTWESYSATDGALNWSSTIPTKILWRKCGYDLPCRILTWLWRNKSLDLLLAILPEDMETMLTTCYNPSL